MSVSHAATIADGRGSMVGRGWAEEEVRVGRPKYFYEAGFFRAIFPAARPLRRQRRGAAEGPPKPPSFPSSRSARPGRG